MRFLPPPCVAAAVIVVGLRVVTAAPALAAEVLDMPNVEVHARRPRFPLQPQSLTTIDRRQIEESGAANLGQLLAQQSAFSIRDYGPVGQLSTATLRGVLGEGVLVLRDGVKLNSPALGGVDLSTVSLVDVDRVEILEGGASSAYGSEAVAGVINLVTSKTPKSRLEAGLGTWGNRYVAAETGGTVGEAAVTAGVRRTYAQNDFPYYYRDQLANRANAQFDGTELSVGARRIWGYNCLDFDLNLNNQEKGIPGPENYPSPEAHQHDLDAIASLGWNQVWDAGPTQKTSLSHLHAETGYTDPRSAYEKATDTVVDSTDLQTQLEWTGDTTVTRWGLGVTHDGLSSTDLGLRDRYTYTTFAHETWFATRRFTGFADLRLDDNSTFGLGTSPRLGMTFELNERNRLRAALGRAYRAPTFNDLYWPQSSQSGGNPSLRPETTTVAEAGYDSQPIEPMRVETTVFWNDGRDTISWLPDAMGKWTPQNLGHTQTRGLEAKATYDVAEWLSLQGGGTWTSAIDLSGNADTEGKRLMYRPDWLAQASVTCHPIHSVGLTVGYAFTGDRYTTAQNTDKLPAFDLWSFRLDWSPTRGDSLWLRIDDLLNTYYQLQPYYPMPGRSFLAAWSHTF